VKSRPSTHEIVFGPGMPPSPARGSPAEHVAPLFPRGSRMRPESAGAVSNSQLRADFGDTGSVFGRDDDEPTGEPCPRSSTRAPLRGVPVGARTVCSGRRVRAVARGDSRPRSGPPPVNGAERALPCEPSPPPGRAAAGTDTREHSHPVPVARSRGGRFRAELGDRCPPRIVVEHTGANDRPRAGPERSRRRRVASPAKRRTVAGPAAGGPTDPCVTKIVEPGGTGGVHGAVATTPDRGMPCPCWSTP